MRAPIALSQLPWRPVLLSWFCSRLVVLLALWLSLAVPGPVRRDDLLGWDAEWYLRIAQEGYSALPPEGRRFFPVLPLLARAVGLPFGDDPAIALLVLANVAAIGYALLAHRVALTVGLGRSVADRMPWVIAFAPGAFVLGMGYTEALYGLLVCTVFLAAGRRNWLLVTVAGVVAGALRPTGIVLMVPIAIEACRGLPELPVRQWIARSAAVAGPALGLAAYLGWSWFSFGNPLEPLTAQTDRGLRGGVIYNPLVSIAGGIQALVDGSLPQAAPLLHLIWVALSVALLVYGAKLLPVSYIAFAAVVVLLAMTARGFTSFERYATSALPLLLIAGRLLDTPARRTTALLLGGTALAAYSFTAFLHAYVP